MNDIVTSEKLIAKDFTSDQEVRWCPGCGDYAIVKGVRASLANMGKTGEHGICIRYRLCRALSILSLDVWLPHDPRPSSGDCDGREACESGTRRLGGFWRWRRSLDRRQPYAPPYCDGTSIFKSCCLTTRSTVSPKANTHQLRRWARALPRHR